MSAAGNSTGPRGGRVPFSMPQRIPPYLLALAVGDLDFAPLGRRSGVYAEPSVVASAAHEFADTERMMAAAERLYGPYRWDRYDILVLPPSFPFGGMENPAPDVRDADRSRRGPQPRVADRARAGALLVRQPRHERDVAATSGSTRDSRPTSSAASSRRSTAARPPSMEAVARPAGPRETRSRRLEDRDEILHIDLTGRDPDDAARRACPTRRAASSCGRWRRLFGRERFDAFLHGYFDRFAFQQRRHGGLPRRPARRTLLRGDGRGVLAGGDPLDEWIERPGLPEAAPRPDLASPWTPSCGSPRTGRPDELASATSIPVGLEHAGAAAVPASASGPAVDRADARSWTPSFGLTDSAQRRDRLPVAPACRCKSELRRDRPAAARGVPRLDRPPQVHQAALRGARQDASPAAGAPAPIYRRARPGYHPIAVDTVDRIVGLVRMSLRIPRPGGVARGERVPARLPGRLQPRRDRRRRPRRRGRRLPRQPDHGRLHLREGAPAAGAPLRARSGSSHPGIRIGREGRGALPRRDAGTRRSGSSRRALRERASAAAARRSCRSRTAARTATSRRTRPTPGSSTASAPRAWRAPCAPRRPVARPRASTGR